MLLCSITDDQMERINPAGWDSQKLKLFIEISSRYVQDVRHNCCQIIRNLVIMKTDMNNQVSYVPCNVTSWIDQKQDKTQNRDPTCMYVNVGSYFIPIYLYVCCVAFLNLWSYSKYLVFCPKFYVNKSINCSPSSAWKPPWQFGQWRGRHSSSWSHQQGHWSSEQPGSRSTRWSGNRQWDRNMERFKKIWERKKRPINILIYTWK